MTTYKLITSRAIFVWTVFFIQALVYAQDCNDTPRMICDPFGDSQGNLNWVWWKNSDNDPNFDECSVWTARISEGSSLVTRGIVNPFRNNNSGEKLAEIIEAKDYLPSKGWVLVQRDFGCTGGGVNNPSFILYNRETGMLRVYVYVVNIKNYNSYLMRLQYGNPEVSGLNSFAIDEAPAQDEFQSGKYDSTKNAFTAHYVAQFDSDLGGNWIVGDFEMAYDPYLQNINGSSSRYQQHYFLVSVMGVSKNKIDANVTGATCSGDFKRCKEVIFSANPADLLNDKDDKVLDKLEKGAKGLKKIVKGGSEISKFFAEQAGKEVENIKKEFEFKFGSFFLKKQATFSTLSGVSNNWQKVQKVFKKISGVTNELPGILSSVSSIAGILGLTETDPPSVTYTQYNLGIKGSLELVAPITNINFFAPGSNINTGMNPTWQPYYKCPMGLGSLKNTPKINIIPFKQTVTNWESPGDWGDESAKLYTNFKSYKSVNDLSFSYPQTGPKPTSVKVSYIVQLSKKHLSKPTARTYNPVFTTFTRHFNLLQYEIETGSLEIASVLYNEPGEEDDEIVLISPAVDIKKFKGSSINVPADAKVNLSIIAVFDNGHILKKNYRYDANLLNNSGTHTMFQLPPYANYNTVIPSFFTTKTIQNQEFAGLGGEALANRCLPENPRLTRQEGPQIFSRNTLELKNVIIHEQGPYAEYIEKCIDQGWDDTIKYEYGPRINPTSPLILETTGSIIIKDGFHAKPKSNVLIRTQQVHRELRQEGNGAIIQYQPPFANCFNENAKSITQNTLTPSDNSLPIQRLTVWPNPTKSYINILSPTTGRIQVYDFKGALILQKDVEKLQENKINTRLWKSGIYLLRFGNQNNQPLYQKIIIQ